MNQMLVLTSDTVNKPIENDEPGSDAPEQQENIRVVNDICSGRISRK